MAMSKHLTENVIDQINDIPQAVQYLDDNKISKKGIANLFEAKLRLIKYVQDRDGIKGSSKEVHVPALFHRLKEKHDMCKQKLKGFYETTTTVLQEICASLVGNPGLVKQISQISERLDQSLLRLESSKCPIVIAGETSSGKSSLLNLILGEEMLPTSTLSTTSIICELRYGEQRRAKVFTWDDQEIDVPLDLSSDQNSLDQLSAYIHHESDRDQELFPYKRAEIYLPLDILKEGITIVDSPGVGENEKMDNFVFDYLNEAFAFIYVINSANAGGIQRDRLGRLLSLVNCKQLEQIDWLQPSKDPATPAFSPQAAIFVCNKWDQVPVHEAQMVQEEQLRVLRRYWHGCTEDQVFRLCTTDAAKALQHGVVMKDFRHLLDGIERLIPVSLQNKLQVYYSLLEQDLCRIKFMLDAIIMNAKTKTDIDRLARLQRAETNLRRLKENLMDKVKEMELKLNGHVEQCVNEIRNLLENNPRVEKLATSWSLADIEQSEVESQTYFRLQNFIMDWEEREEHFKKAKEDMEGMFGPEISEIERDVFAIEQHFAGQVGLSMAQVMNSYSSSSKESVLSLRQRMLMSSIKTLNTLYSRSRMFILSSKSFFWRKVDEMKSTENLNVNKLEVMRKQGLKVLAKFKEREALQTYVENQLKPSQGNLSRAQNICKEIEFDLTLVDHLQKGIMTVEEGLQNKIVHRYMELTKFGNDYLATTD